MCICHPRSPEDEKVWREVKSLPPSKAEWAFLHDCLERYEQFRIDQFKGISLRASSPAVPQQGEPPQ